MFIRNTNRNPLCGRGDINLYSIFAELNFTLLARNGRSGLVLQSGIASDDTTSLFYQMLSQGGHIISLYDFENKELIFSDIAPVIKFCLLTLEKNRKTSDREALYLFLARGVNEIGNANRHFTLSNSDLELFNPNSRTCPIFRSRTDCELSKVIYRQLPILLPTDKIVAATRGSRWNIEFETMFHLSGDSGCFKTLEELTESGYNLNGNRFSTQSSTCEHSSYLPLFEAKLFNQFNYRENTFAGIPLKDRFKVKAPTRKSTESELADLFYSNLPRYWVAEVDVMKKAKYDRAWLLAFRDMTNVMTNARNAIFAILPQCAIGHSAPVMHLKDASEATLMCAIGNSFIFDYCVRQMLAGSHLTYFILKQLPVPSRIELLEPCPWNQDISWQEYILQRATKLICTSIWLREYAAEISESLDISPCSLEEQKTLRYELDAAMFYLYFKPTGKGHWDSELNFNPDGIGHAQSHLIATPRSAIEYVMNTFTIVKKKEIGRYGEYVTLRGVLEVWDRLFGG